MTQFFPTTEDFLTMTIFTILLAILAAFFGTLFGTFGSVI